MHLRKAGYIVLITCFVCFMAFCVWYLASDYQTLKTQYISLNNCFYRSNLWASEFFTPVVKTAGNKWCIAGLMACVTGILWLLRVFRKRVRSGYSIKLSLNWEAVIISVIALGLAIYSYLLLMPAYDEIFSAINVAGLPVFQAWSYYMLPNNHILFNVVNAFIFAPFRDHVMTGRWLSIVAYMLTAVTIWQWLKTSVKTPVLRILFVALILLQLPVWGFSAQARGYSWQLLAGWILFVHGITYLRTGDDTRLSAIMWSTCLGYCLIPSFLHFHLAVIAFAALIQLNNRKFDIRFWQYQCCAGVFIFLFYLPALCFSGLGAFAENRYVANGTASLNVFAPEFLSVFKYYIKYSFSFLLGEDSKIGYVLFAAPLFLIFSKSNHKKWLAIFYAIMWVVFILLVLYMKRIPFSRNLTIHFSITLTMAGYAVYTLLYLLGEKLRTPIIAQIVFGLACAAISFHFISSFPKNAVSILYFNPVNELYASNTKSIRSIPNNTTVYFSPESFYWRYLRVKQRLPANYCQTGQEQYLIKRVTGELSPVDTTGYRKIQTFPDDYELWQKQ